MFGHGELSALAIRKRTSINLLVICHHSPAWWCRPVISALKEVEAGGSHNQDQSWLCSKTNSQSQK